MSSRARTAPDRLTLARLGQRIEHEWVGAQTGLLDQLASLGGGPGQALLIDFQTLETKPIPLELGDHRLVVLDSGETHMTAASEYNRRRAECMEAAAASGWSLCGTPRSRICMCFRMRSPVVHDM